MTLFFGDNLILLNCPFCHLHSAFTFEKKTSPDRGTYCLAYVLTTQPFEFWTYFQPLSLGGTKRLTVFENGADSLITDVTVRTLSRPWKSGKEGIGVRKDRREEFSEEQSENR